MGERKDGGPAFPHMMAEGHRDYAAGMSLRDWFAGQAMAAFLSQSHAGPKEWTNMGHGWGEDCANDLNKHGGAVAHTLAAFAYKCADAMLAARSSQEGAR